MKTCLCLLIVLLVAGCQPAAPATPLPITPFPTTTPGQTLRGILTPAAARPAVLLANPATIEALSGRATATPDTSACPALTAGVSLPGRPAADSAAGQLLLDYLNAGGAPDALEEVLLTGWSAPENSAYLLRNDLTGSGTPDLLLGYVSPEGVGTLLIVGCSDGRYVLRYQTSADGEALPQVISLGDINRSGRNELLFARRVCQGEACEFETQLLEWSWQRGRFVNLINTPLVSLNIPAVRDIDNDQVGELVLTLDNRGSAATGPLRTGVNIFDWNGAAYVLSIVQLDPPRYRIQVVQEADKAFSRLDMTAAAATYQQALDNADLRDWFNDEERILIAYIYYRLILVYAYTGDVRLSEVLARLNVDYATGSETTLNDLPAYVQMAYAFISTLENTRSLRLACEEVQKIIVERPSALQLLNRYGSRSPTYDALALCPY
ncbi:MAG: hypothetical protein MUE40_09435 [Anaerolineae bacterium]|nr:hypothetical protein [Anaerolineae bacterium]